ncbi:MAG: hypothetical protein ABI388_11115 [Bacteroidia bacterium]
MLKQLHKIFLLLCILHITLAKAQSIITTIAGNGTAGYNGDGSQALTAELNGLTGLKIDRVGNLYIADTYNNVVRKIAVNGIITTVVGSGIAGYSGDGGIATLAKLNGPTDIEIDSLGQIYVADNNNNCIRIINSSGIITTFAGTGVAGYSGDLGYAISAKLNLPIGLALDTHGNLYVADSQNNVIRKINIASGIINTIIGNGVGAGTGVGGYSGDGGPAINAELFTPWYICFDLFDNLYITDFNNNVIRKASTTGIISTYAGGGNCGSNYCGDGGQATASILNGPTAIVCDSLGNIYISDSYNAVIRKVDTNGIINTITGNGIMGYAGDGGQPTMAKLNYPYGLVIDKFYNLFIADALNNRIRKVTHIETTNINQLPVTSYQFIQTL